MPARKRKTQMRTNEQWLEELTTPNDRQDEAIADLRALLVRGALYSLRQTRYRLASWDAEHLEQLDQAAKKFEERLSTSTIPRIVSAG